MNIEVEWGWKVKRKVDLSGLIKLASQTKLVLRSGRKKWSKTVSFWTHVLGLIKKRTAVKKTTRIRSGLWQTRPWCRAEQQHLHGWAHTTAATKSSRNNSLKKNNEKKPHRGCIFSPCVMAHWWSMWTNSQSAVSPSSLLSACLEHQPASIAHINNDRSLKKRSCIVVFLVSSVTWCLKNSVTSKVFSPSFAVSHVPIRTWETSPTSGRTAIFICKDFLFL